MKTRRKFGEAFKLEVVRMIRGQQLSVPELSRTMGIGETVIRHWVHQYEDEINGGSGTGLPLTAEQQCIRELEAEVSRRGPVIFPRVVSHIHAARHPCEPASHCPWTGSNPLLLDCIAQTAAPLGTASEAGRPCLRQHASTCRRSIRVVRHTLWP